MTSFTFSECGITFLAKINKGGPSSFKIFLADFILKKSVIVFMPFLEAIFAIFIAGSIPRTL